MAAFFAWISSWLVSIPLWFLGLVKTVFLVLWDMLGDFMAWLFDTVLTVVVSLVAAIPIPSSFQAANIQSMMSGAPSETLNMLAAIQLPAALAIITAALGIRFVMQLIPFIRLGS